MFRSCGSHMRGAPPPNHMPGSRLDLAAVFSPGCIFRAIETRKPSPLQQRECMPKPLRQFPAPRPVVPRGAPVVYAHAHRELGRGRAPQSGELPSSSHRIHAVGQHQGTAPCSSAYDRNAPADPA